jgi:hypothetical protein
MDFFFAPAGFLKGSTHPLTAAGVQVMLATVSKKTGAVLRRFWVCAKQR